MEGIDRPTDYGGHGNGIDLGEFFQAGEFGRG